MSDTAPLSRDQLIHAMSKGEKPRDQWRIGAEHEKFGFDKSTLRRPAYEGENGILAMLTGLQRFGWSPVEETGRVIALERKNAEGFSASISLEPGGQFELSGAPLKDIHDICNETGQHLMEVKQVADQLNLGFLGLGFDPMWRREDIPVMPKGRYDIMRAYMPKKGDLGLDMMLRTCTIQANLDFDSEADMVMKFRTSLALQPIATALFANSPFTEGRPNGFLSARANVWTDTDPDRTGMLDFVFEDGFGYERYADYALDAPMYFAKRGETYVDLSGQSFRAFMDGKLDALPGDRATAKDWADHLTTLFPEVRLKQYLEMRGADGGPWSRICALPALWAGILYDAPSLAAAWDLCKDWDIADHERLRRDVTRLGLKAEVNGRSVRDIAVDMVNIAKQGLKNRARFSGGMVDERGYITELEDIADSGVTSADRLLELYNGEWGGDVSRVYRDMAY
ncbi:Glutamate--cysteine ligase GshA [Brevundimonas diminuta]|uniref:glutamate--cysteine ligase n=1 Tax=Brevundimonas diminuta TaxID=293 RepID=UPI000207EA11|nr:glutamate--cysteine ligase [Brevundimonas diminuta]EGF96571.1 glutamate--cysteine ligase [Brevundimonas diminuta ATCC 11568]OWR18524.1 glutamate--cysteine ligase [Brevundimonas diminuta]WQE44597.1 glutamate--cysteine ligase [Brevundimonas diminuta]SPU47440.1 Glutamate--cysteine ligase GshA [Brevundimonas diminuta]SUW17108.1 Glutamate--cysteine ligase GshA [Brevundimonas diminuta]